MPQKMNQCPKCQQYKARPVGEAKALMIIGLAVNTVGVIVWPLLAIGIPVFLLGLICWPIGALMSRGRPQKMLCFNCYHKFKV